MEAIDLLQLHCPPTSVYYMPETFGVLDDLVQAGKLRYYGVSVEKVEEALKAIEYPNVQTVQIIFNIFRHAPGGIVLPGSHPPQGGHSGAGAAGLGHAHGQDDAKDTPLRRTTTACSTGRARPLTAARPSRAWITKPGWQRWKN